MSSQIRSPARVPRQAGDNTVTHLGGGTRDGLKQTEASRDAKRTAPGTKGRICMAWIAEGQCGQSVPALVRCSPLQFPAKEGSQEQPEPAAGCVLKPGCRAGPLSGRCCSNKE